jgi:hypothetical protein
MKISVLYSSSLSHYSETEGTTWGMLIALDSFTPLLDEKERESSNILGFESAFQVPQYALPIIIL